MELLRVFAGSRAGLVTTKQRELFAHDPEGEVTEMGLVGNHRHMCAGARFMCGQDTGVADSGAAAGSGVASTSTLASAPAALRLVGFLVRDCLGAASVCEA